MINFSFVIPHKNSPELLQKCLDSIPKRDDVQIIVVDDNSDPEKVDFEHFPGLNEPHTEVYFTKEGGGCAFATNVAMDHAIGKWIVRADADDFFNPCIVDAMNQYVDSNYDIVFFKGNAINLETGEKTNRGQLYYNLVDKAIKFNDYRELFCISTPCRKFYNRAFIEKHHLRLHEVRWSTEVVFCAKIAVLAETYDASPLEIYCVTESPNSMLSNTSLACRIVRFEEDTSAVNILRKKYADLEFIYYWHFITWFNLYKTSKIQAIKRIPQAVNGAGFRFLIQCFKAKFR